MKRDWELIRNILFKVEEMESTNAVLEDNVFEGVSPELVSYHIQLLIEAGLLVGQCHQGLGGPLQCYIHRLTWNGHEFLDASRDNSRWKKAKEILLSKGGALTFDVLKALLISLLKEAANG